MSLIATPNCWVDGPRNTPLRRVDATTLTDPSYWVAGVMHNPEKPLPEGITVPWQLYHLPGEPLPHPDMDPVPTMFIKRGVPLRVVGSDARGKQKLGAIDGPDQYLEGLVYEPTPASPDDPNVLVRVGMGGGIYVRWIAELLGRSLTADEIEAISLNSPDQLHGLEG